MKTLLAVLLLTLAACTRQPADATGVYRLSTPEKSMVLQVRTSGVYVLQIDGPDRNPDEIRGRWEEGRGAGPGLAFHGVVWHGTEPASGQGVWAATFRRNAELCLDAEGLACFSKEDGA
ncbi:hypothetical protein [Massilia sp. GCM10023247]|uniref:hypothetical protein n=1 Tax=Massilia sp. GCM10023247 TaxID=3252643 RepID=UPI00361D6737